MQWIHNQRYILIPTGTARTTLTASRIGITHLAIRYNVSHFLYDNRAMLFCVFPVCGRGRVPDTGIRETLDSIQPIPDLGNSVRLRREPMMTPWGAPDDLIDLLSKRSRVNVTRIKPPEPPLIVKGLDHIICPIRTLPVLSVVLSWTDNILHPVETSLCITVKTHLNNFLGIFVDTTGASLPCLERP